MSNQTDTVIIPGTVRETSGLVIPEWTEREILLWSKALGLVDNIEGVPFSEVEIGLLEVGLLCEVGYVLEIWNGLSWEPFCKDTIRQAAKMNDSSCCDHKSDCAQHNEPAEPVGGCDCGVGGDEPHSYKAIHFTDREAFDLAVKAATLYQPSKTIMNSTFRISFTDLQPNDWVQIDGIRYIYSPELT